MASSSERQERFKEVSEEELTKFIDSADSDNTKKQIKYGLSVFSEFCNQVQAGNFTDADISTLDVLLSKFYAGARNQKGGLYSKKSMQSIRYGLQRHFLAKRGFDIVNSTDFPMAKSSFKSLLVKLKEQGKASVKHHSPVSDSDMALIQRSLDVTTARGLQQKVFIDTMVYFANRGMENLRSMKPADFVLHSSVDNSREFFSLRDMHTKNHRNDDEESQGGRMYSIPGDDHCPVAMLKKYKAKLNLNCEAMWQRPKNAVCEEDGVWYDNSPLGKDSLSTMAKKISQAAGCSKIYTNHCLRATSVTLLDHAGFASRDIMTVSGHKSETSIKNYVRTSEAQKQKMSDSISSAIIQEPVSDEFVNIPLSDSQVASIFEDIAQSSTAVNPLPRENAILPMSPSTANSLVVTNQHKQENAAFHFHGCVVNIYNK